ncbi:MAG: hypothetical protein V2I31_08510, partial [Mariniphaga sp.]|nr:hypothetical protein [Mariniphaga sp.]
RVSGALIALPVVGLPPFFFFFSLFVIEIFIAGSKVGLFFIWCLEWVAHNSSSADFADKRRFF